MRYIAIQKLINPATHHTCRYPEDREMLFALDALGPVFEGSPGEIMEQFDEFKKSGRFWMLVPIENR